MSDTPGEHLTEVRAIPARTSLEAVQWIVPRAESKGDRSRSIPRGRRPVTFICLLATRVADRA